MSFTDVERDDLRRKLAPDFEWTTFARPTAPVPIGKPVDACRVALVVTSGAYLAASQPPGFTAAAAVGDHPFCQRSRFSSSSSAADLGLDEGVEWQQSQECAALTAGRLRACGFADTSWSPAWFVRCVDACCCSALMSLARVVWDARSAPVNMTALSANRGVDMWLPFVGAGPRASHGSSGASGVPESGTEPGAEGPPNSVGVSRAQRAQAAGSVAT